MLAPVEAKLLCQLSVFAGGWELAGAEAVGAGLDDEAVLHVLKRLADKSLVVVDHMVEERPRYRLLEPIREFLAAKLTAGNEAPATRRRHLAYCLALAEQLEAQTRDARQRAALATLDCEQDDLRAAMEWGLASTEAGATARIAAAELAYRLGRYWYVRQQWREGRAWVGRALAAMAPWRADGDASTDGAHEETATLYARLLFRLGYLAAGQGELPVAEEFLTQSLVQHRALGNQREVARCLQELGSIASEQGAYACAAVHLEESLVCIRPLGDDWLLALSLAKLADVAGEQNDYARCQVLAAEYLSIARRLGDAGQLMIGLNLLAQCVIADKRYRDAVTQLQEALALHRSRDPGSMGGPWTLRNLGLARQMLGDYAQAAACYAQSLRLRWEQEQPGGMAWALEGMGELCALAGQPRDAARCWGAASQLRRSVGSHPAQNERERQAALVAQGQATCGSGVFLAAWAEGETMHNAELISFIDDVAHRLSAHEPT